MTSPRLWREDGVTHIDVSAMEPPGPFVTILRWIDGPDGMDEVVVHLARDPEHLFPELVERGWTWTYLEAETGGVSLRLTRE